MSKEKKQEKTTKVKIVEFIKNLGLILFFLVVVAGFLYLKSAGETKGVALDTKRKVRAVSQNDSVAKGFEINQSIAIEVISKLDSAKFDSYQIATIEMFGNKYSVHKLNKDYFCAVYNNQDTIMIDKLNDTRIWVMNRMYVDTRTDELNDYLGGWFI